jgi:bifunctional UDP-N-acetylglucosamine pyrophosphorylase / glucosamine-1-phosphate N-acetyltransferase
MPDMTSTTVDEHTAAVVLAAGKGKRMRSSLPKVLHVLAGRPMVLHVVDTLTEMGFGEAAPLPVVVVGQGSDDVRRILMGRASFVIQSSALGTGNAAAIGLQPLDPTISRVLLIHGDEPMIEASTYRQMLLLQHESGAAIMLLTGEVSDTQGLGRVVRDSGGRITALVQEQELTPEERLISEINFGAYVLDRPFMEAALPSLQPLHAGGEYHLPDLIRYAAEHGFAVDNVVVPYPDEQMGINDPAQLARAERFLRRKAS